MRLTSNALLELLYKTKSVTGCCGVRSLPRPNLAPEGGVGVKLLPFDEMREEHVGPIENPSRTTSDSCDRIVGVIYSALSELNLQLPKGDHVEQSLSTVLSGAGGRLDSLALANFIVIAETKLEESLGFQIDLTQDDPFSPGTGHFQTVQSLVSYISRLVQQRFPSDWGMKCG
jgi:acyl carrier protein